MSLIFLALSESDSECYCNTIVSHIFAIQCSRHTTHPLERTQWEGGRNTLRCQKEPLNDHAVGNRSKVRSLTEHTSADQKLR